MSLLRPKVSESVPSYDDDEPQSLGWSKLDGHDDGFADDADADDLSFDGIYDDDPPVYHAEPSVANVENLRDSSPHSLPGLFNGLNIAPNTVGISNRNPRQQRYYPGIDVCIVCQDKPPFSKNGRSYPTCGLTCAGILRAALNNNDNSSPPARNSRRSPSIGSLQASPSAARTQRPFRPNPIPHASSSSTVDNTNTPPTDPCVVCRKRSCFGDYVTCGLRCAEELCTKGSADPKMCNYCHRRPKLMGHDQCGKICADAAKIACLLCKSRPKYKQYHLCGKSCSQISTKRTPLLLDAPEGHDTWELVQKKFESAWKMGTKPTIKKIYKIIESKDFLLPYDQYKKRIGRRTEVFRYHGTSRKCTLGSNGNTFLCNDTRCSLCSILKTSFKTTLANPHGAFGAGIYTSSAANKAYNYSDKGLGAMILTKVVLGNVHNVDGFGVVTACPVGCNSVVFDRHQGSLNETIVYSDDAIRPVFLIIFK